MKHQRNGKKHSGPPNALGAPSAKEEPSPKSTSQVRLLLVDDHTLFREALASLLALDPRVVVIGEAGEGTHALNLIATLKPDVVLLDLSMPGMHGTEVLRQVRLSYPMVKCLVLTVHLSEPIVRAAIQAGAAGYLLKEATRTELSTAIHSVAKGHLYISPLIADKVLSGYIGMFTPSQREINPWQILSEQEQDVLKQVAEGATNKEIAAALCISVRTVEKHRASLTSKLNLKTTAALTAYAIEQELVTSAAVIRRDHSSKEH